tara:strand:- start:23 stop:937 length:915 start_codon:yes stop_codon:yes gene_type:complete
MECCLTPELAVEISLQPVRRHGVDAAIFFSDITVPLVLAGLPIKIIPNLGPTLENPIRRLEDLKRLRSVSADDLEPITQAVRMLVRELGSTPLIGFGGAPFTLASYLIEGGPSKDLPYTKRIMKSEPRLWAGILGWCAEITTAFVHAQVDSGAEALQIFDSWAGKLSVEEYRNFAAPFSQILFSNLESVAGVNQSQVPRLHFGVGTKGILLDMLSVGATAIGVDSLTTLEEASKILGREVPLQGNIDPSMLGEPEDVLHSHVRGVLADGESLPGHVVNLGHGVPPDTNPDVLTKLVDLVHSETA